MKIVINLGNFEVLNQKEITFKYFVDSSLLIPFPHQVV